MQNLRNAHNITRLVLVWFALFLGAAIASPIVSHNPTQLVCSASGVMTVVSTGGDSTGAANGHTLDCPLCTGIGAPPPLSLIVFDPVQPLGYALQSFASAHIASASAAPLPARGPPTLL